MLRRLCENKKITPSFTTGIAKPPRIRALAQITLKIFYVFTLSLRRCNVQIIIF